MNCPNCDGNGCGDCGGSGDVTGCVACEDALPAEDSDRCARCGPPPTIDPCVVCHERPAADGGTHCRPCRIGAARAAGEDPADIDHDQRGESEAFRVLYAELTRE